MEEYNPRTDTREILQRALELVNSVSYKVSARWLFYRLLQEGYYSSKADYRNKFTNAISSARKAFYNGWRPDTLADETREAIIRGEGYDGVPEWLDRLASGISCNLDKWRNQDYYIEIWYEARAMTEQFKHYTRHITLRPMGGHASIPYKWEIAKDLEACFSKYQKPIKILYFGDLDPAGETIFEVVERDVRDWCEVDFDVIHCGLTEDQVIRYNVPENLEKPGEYQWEALSDEGASEVITNAVNQFFRHDRISQIRQSEAIAEKWLDERLAGLPLAWSRGD